MYYISECKLFCGYLYSIPMKTNEIIPTLVCSGRIIQAILCLVKVTSLAWGKEKAIDVGSNLKYFQIKYVIRIIVSYLAFSCWLILFLSNSFCYLVNHRLFELEWWATSSRNGQRPQNSKHSLLAPFRRLK